MGAVYRAFDRVTQQAVAVKVLRDSADEAVVRFGFEARVLGEIEHPHVVRYVAHGQLPSGQPYLAMEWLDGQTLAGRLVTGPLGIEETVELGRRVASGLGEAHARGIVHRDVKPGNLLLHHGDVRRVKLLDFGIVRADAMSPALTVTGTLIGTPGYMAPEQAKGPRSQFDGRIDVFSLGCVLFECLTGRPAFQGTHLLARLAKLLMEDPPRVRELRPEVPEALDELIVQMLSKNPDGRPADGHAVVALLERMGSLEGPLTLPRPAPPQSLTHTEKRLVSVVAVVPPKIVHAEDSGANQDPSTLLDDVRGAVRPYGAKIEEIANGMFIALLVGTGPATDQAANAARCALRMRYMMPGASIVLLTGRGENTGRLPVGDVFESAASLLEQMSASEQSNRGIYIDDITRALLDARFSVTEEDGRLGLRGEQFVGSEARTLLGKPSPFVGRDRELRHLLELVEDAIEERHGRVVLVTGEAGTGKSRLRYEFLQRLRSTYPDLAISIGRGDWIGAGSAFALMASGFRTGLEIAKADSLDEGRSKLAAVVAAHVGAADRARVTEFLCEMIGLPLADGDDPRMRAARQNPAIMADQIQSAYVDLVRGILAVRAIVFVLEDLHWGDGPSIKLVDAALRELSDKPYIVVAFARPEVHQVFPQVWAGRGVHSMTLGGLSRRGCETLIKSTLGSKANAATISAMVDRSGGNAFYLEELIRAVNDGHGGQLPETVLGMVEARIATLEPEERRILRAASIFGDTFWQRGVNKLLRDDLSNDSAAYIKDLCARELIVRRSTSRFSGETEYGFRHSLLREGAYAMLTDRDRALGHDLAAGWLVRAGEKDPMVLAAHFERGTTPEKAAAFYVKAAEHAMQGADFQSAIARAEKGLAVGATGETKAALQAVLSNVHILTAQYAKCYEISASILADSSLGPSSRARALGHAVASAIFLGRFDAFGELFPEILTIEPEPNVAALVTRALYPVFVMFVVTGQAHKGIPYLRRMEEIAARYGGTDFLVSAWSEFAFTFASRELHNDPWQAREHIQASSAHYAAAGAREYQAITCAHLGLSYMQLGLLTDAEELFNRVLALPYAGKLSLMYATYYKSRLFLEWGRFDEALSAAETLANDVMAANDRVMFWCARLLAVGILMASGKLDEADAILDELGEANAFLPFLRARFLSHRGEICRKRGHAEEAVRLTALSVEIGRAGPRYNYGEDPLRLRHALALHAAGDLDGARRVIQEARDDILGCAEKIPDHTVRMAYLETIAAHAQTLGLAREWLGE